MAHAFSYIDCTEVDGTRQESYGDTSSARVTLQCAYDDRYLLVSDLLMWNKTWPWSRDLVAKSCAIKHPRSAMRNDGQAGWWEYAWVDVVYDDTGGDEAFSEELAPTAEFLTLDYRQFRWSSGDPLVDGESPGVPLYSLELRRTYYNVRIVPEEFLTQIAHVNADAYQSRMLNLTFGPETLLFKPGNCTRKITTSGEGVYRWQVTLAFQFKPQGWNRFFRAKTNQWEEIFAVGARSPLKPYTLGSFGSMLD